MESTRTESYQLRRLALLAVVLALTVAGLRACSALGESGGFGPVDPPLLSRNDTAASGPLPIADSLYGRSGKVRVKTLTRAEALAIPGFFQRYGERALRTAAEYSIPLTDGTTFTYIVLHGFGEKKGEMLAGYRLGRWPAERWLMTRNYFNPDGFVEVRPETQSLRLTPHLTLGDLVTHDQRDRWPKFVVLEEKLLDKIELVLADLAQRGIAAHAIRVLSGFRAPYYNDRGVNEGMARASRHQYGDALDLIIDADDNGRMDDVNRDGRVDLDDVEVVLASVDRVERRYPELRGGAGRYRAQGPSGPFVHVDVRGTSARWESGWWKRRSPSDEPPTR